VTVILTTSVLQIIHEVHLLSDLSSNQKISDF
jgi:hypothetical protein